MTGWRLGGIVAEWGSGGPSRCLFHLCSKLIMGAVRMFYVMNSALPASLEVLAKKDGRGRSQLESLPNDPWGNAYKLVLGDSPGDFKIKSAGADGKHGTDDDLPAK